MTPLSANRYTDYFREGKTSIPLSFPVAASTHIYKGSHVAFDAAGNLVACSSSLALKYAGLAEDEIDNSAGLAGALSCRVYLSGVDTLPKSGTITDADRGTLLQLLDDNTAALALASLTTTMGGSNNDMLITAKWPWDGLRGTLITVQLRDPAGNSQALGVRLEGTNVIFDLATSGGGAITSTPTTIAALIAAAATPAAAAIRAMISIANAGADTGANAVTALAATQLALTGPVGGQLEKMDGSLAVMRWVAGGRK